MLIVNNPKYIFHAQNSIEKCKAVAINAISNQLIANFHAKKALLENINMNNKIIA